MGPIALFDKSFLQALNIDESVWLDHYFMRNIGDSLVQIAEEDIRLVGWQNVFWQSSTGGDESRIY